MAGAEKGQGDSGQAEQRLELDPKGVWEDRKGLLIYF